MRTLVIASQKGGVGKTTIAGHLAVMAESRGAGPVALIDTDPQGSLSRRVAQTVGNHWSGSANIDGIIACKAWIPAVEMRREIVVEHCGAHL